MKKDKVRDTFLEHLRKVPIVQVACEKVNVSRTSVYRWREADPDFAKAMDEALEEGEGLVNDMSESQLLTLIREKNFAAISFWLRHRNRKFRERLDVTAHIEKDERLTPEQEELVRKALELTLGTTDGTNHDEQKPNDTGRPGGADDAKPEDTNSDH